MSYTSVVKFYVDRMYHHAPAGTFNLKFHDVVEYVDGSFDDPALPGSKVACIVPVGSVAMVAAVRNVTIIVDMMAAILESKSPA